MWLSAVLTLSAGVFAAWAVAPRVPAGDEPHYLTIAQSLLEDHDLRIENNYRQRDYAAYFSGTLAPDYLARGRDGQIYSIHAPGVSALVLPAFALFGYRGAEGWLLLLSAVTGSLIWRLGWRATGDVGAAWFSWAAIVGSATFLLHSFTVFPDGPGALVVAAAAWLLIRLQQDAVSVTWRRLVVVSALLAALPWFHTRMVVLAVGFGAAIVWTTLTDRARPVAGRVRRAAVFLAVPAVSAMGWFTFFQVIYGTLNPAAPYGSATGTRAAYVPGGLAGLFFDEQFGVLAYAPVLLAAALGASRQVPPPVRRACGAVVAIALVYLAAVATYWMWWAGWPANPGRFVVAVLPAFAIPLAVAWTTGDAARRRAMLAWAAVSVAISVLLLGVGRGALAWNTRDAQALWLEWLGPVVNLPRAWPSFFWKLIVGAGAAGGSSVDLRSELAFVWHVAWWMAVFVGGWLAVRRLSLGRSWRPETWRVAIALWMTLGVMVAAQGGWSLNGTSGLAPAPSQAALLGRAWHGAPVLDIAPWTWRAATPPGERLAIRSRDSMGSDAAPPWFLASNLPAGEYEVHVATSRPTRGQVAVSVGDTSWPITTVDLDGLNRLAFPLTLPTGAGRLVMTPDGVAAGVRGQVTLTPVRPGRQLPELALSEMRYGAIDVGFLDDDVFIEHDGFWVRGGQSAHLVVSTTGGASGAPMTLRNGASPNVITIAAGTERHDLDLAPSESRVIQVPLNADGSADVTINAAKGFRPSDISTSADRRFLGVWVGF